MEPRLPAPPLVVTISQGRATNLTKCCCLIWGSQTDLCIQQAASGQGWALSTAMNGTGWVKTVTHQTGRGSHWVSEKSLFPVGALAPLKTARWLQGSGSSSQPSQAGSPLSIC